MSGRALRVLTYTTLYPGPGRPFHGLFVRRRIERLAEMCDLRVVAPIRGIRGATGAEDSPRTADPDGVPVARPRFLVLPGLLKHLDGDLLYLQSRAAARRLAGERGVDVVDAHYAYPDGHAAARIARELGVPYVLSVRGSDVHVLPRFPARRRLVARALGGAARVVAVSRPLAAAAERLGADPAKIRVIPNGVDTGSFRPRDRRSARETLGLPPESPLLLSVGRLEPVKGFDLLVRAAARLRRRPGPAVRCVIVGEGPSRRSLLALARAEGASDEIVLPGSVRPQDLPAWYSAADLFVLPSASEGCPNVVVEALACGTPVVASAVGGIPDMVRDGTHGYLLRERTAEALAALLERALARAWDPAAVRSSDAVRDWAGVAASQLEALEEAARS